MARPRIEIDKKKFEQYCNIQCTQEEIAYLCDCSADTIDRWCKRTYKQGFAEVYKKHSQYGKMSLRRSMFKMACTGKGNATLLIWLSKQHLSMTDQPVDESARECYTELPSLTQDKDSSDD